MTHTPEDEHFMRRALELAAKGPLVDPNPRVGALVVAAGEVVGSGWHRGAGTPHAEIHALADAGDAARGATVYVTLEPCNHTGRTGPCAQALIAAGVARVVYGSADPGATSGGGAATLRAAGVRVEPGVLSGATGWLNSDWEFATRRGRPRVTWKYAATLDGRVAAADGTSKWITGAEARADVGRARSRHGAVLVGTGTILADDSHLAARDIAGNPLEHQPLRVVMGTRDLPADARVFDDAAETLVLRTHDVAAALGALHDRGIHSVWLEGGPTLAAAFWRAGCVDDVIAWLGPKLLGAGQAAVTDLGVGTIDDAIVLHTVDVRSMGADVRWHLRVARPGDTRGPAGDHTPDHDDTPAHEEDPH